ncbi:hypothetical protein [Streptomyces sp. NPDC047014]|uniref:hypothetical protein n=1 Tax=Streptomyces sp. NPDC047014 TaxID=3155736 RepID=UPI0033F84E5E
MRTAIGYTVESIGYVIGAQGFIGFASRAFFGAEEEWGWLHKVVDLPPGGYLGILAAGLVLIAAGVGTRKTPRRRETA